MTVLIREAQDLCRRRRDIPDGNIDSLKTMMPTVVEFSFDLKQAFE